MATVSTAASFDVLTAARYVLITTFRRDGTPVPTPVVGAVADGVFYTTTGGDSGKVKRIRRDHRVTIGACTRRGEPTGPTYAATARLLDGDEGQRAFRLKESRNPLAKLMRIVATNLYRTRLVGLAIEPASTVDLPQRARDTAA
jgi:PPOX class probable F420-dependent enzyme